MRRSSLAVFLASILLAAPAAKSQSHTWTKHEVAVGAAINLKDFGGSDVDLTVKSREMSAIYVEWTDHTKKTKKVFRDATGYARTREVSPTTQQTIKKEKGIPVPGGMSEAYLIYEDQPTGLKVYFYDTIAKQNQYVLLIEPGPPAKKE